MLSSFLNHSITLVSMSCECCDMIICYIGKEGSSLREITMKLSQSRSLTNLNTSCGLDERGHFLVPLQHSHMVGYDSIVHISSATGPLLVDWF